MPKARKKHAKVGEALRWMLVGEAKNQAVRSALERPRMTGAEIRDHPLRKAIERELADAEERLGEPQIKRWKPKFLFGGFHLPTVHSFRTVEGVADAIVALRVLELKAPGLAPSPERDLLPNGEPPRDRRRTRHADFSDGKFRIVFVPRTKLYVALAAEQAADRVLDLDEED